MTRPDADTRSRPAPLLRRERLLERLATEEFDVLVIGGGVTGCGAALDAASRGLSVALVEKRDFAAGTSSRSSKLIHGGLRYLEQFDIGLAKRPFHRIRSGRRASVNLPQHIVDQYGHADKTHQQDKHHQPQPPARRQGRAARRLRRQRRGRSASVQGVTSSRSSCQIARV